jgi:hypothetical protein
MSLVNHEYSSLKVSSVSPKISYYSPNIISYSSPKTEVEVSNIVSPELLGMNSEFVSNDSEVKPDIIEDTIVKPDIIEDTVIKPDIIEDPIVKPDIIIEDTIVKLDSEIKPVVPNKIERTPDVGANDNEANDNDIDVRIKPETYGNVVNVQICSFCCVTSGYPIINK